MKMIIAFSALVAVALAAPQRQKEEVAVVKNTLSDSVTVVPTNSIYDKSIQETAQVNQNAGTPQVIPGLPVPQGANQNVFVAKNTLLDNVTVAPQNPTLGLSNYRTVESRQETVQVKNYAGTNQAITGLSAPQGDNEKVFIVEETLSDNIGLGAYSFSYKLSNGESRQETAKVKNAGTDEETIEISGMYTWIDPETKEVYTVNYTADENGYHPVGEHIP